MKAQFFTLLSILGWFLASSPALAAKPNIFDLLGGFLGIPNNPCNRILTPEEINTAAMSALANHDVVFQSVNSTADIAPVGDFIRHDPITWSSTLSQLKANDPSISVDDLDDVNTLLNQQQAAEACAKVGGRLPSMTELIHDFAKRNTGIVIISFQDFILGKLPSGFEKSDFSLIAESFADGTLSTFYYSKKNYHLPEGELGRYWMRSSSFHPDGIGAGMFSGHFGVAGFNARDEAKLFVATRCVPL